MVLEPAYDPQTGLATETEAERQARVNRERAVIATAEANHDAGLGLDWDFVIDQLEQENDRSAAIAPLQAKARAN